MVVSAEIVKMHPRHRSFSKEDVWVCLNKFENAACYLRVVDMIKHLRIAQKLIRRKAKKKEKNESEFKNKQA